MQEGPHTRRQVLRWGLGAGGLLMLDGLGAPHRALSAQQGEGFELLDVVPFANESRNFIGRMAGEGRDSRRALDLTRLTSKSLITPTEQFFVRTRHPTGLDSAVGWKVTVEGLVEEPKTLDLGRMEAMAVPLGAQLLECAGSSRNSGFGLMSAAEWHGVPIAAVVEGVKQRPEAARVLVSGLDPQTGAFPGGNWIFTLEELTSAGAALATRMNGEPLPELHGRPVRLVLPGWYGCCWVKWVTKIVFLPDDVEATSQMREFAGRTHQRGMPKLARDYSPAVMDPVALPIRVEMWRRQNDIFYRVVGVAWGGAGTMSRPAVRFEPSGPFTPVENFAPPATATWTLWSHLWRPQRAGRHAIELRFENPTLRTRRMDSGFYLRNVVIPEV